MKRRELDPANLDREEPEFPAILVRITTTFTKRFPSGRDLQSANFFTFMEPRIDSKESIPPAYVACAGI